MNRAKIKQLAVVLGVAFITIFGLMGYESKVYAADDTPTLEASTQLIRQGMQGEEVEELQERLKELDFFKVNITGYFGDITKEAVMNFQKSRGLQADGIVGPKTIASLYGKQQMAERAASISRGGISRQNVLVPWFDGGEDIFTAGTQATVTDIDTKISFKVQRTGGYNHSDTETLTKEDTASLMKIFGGKWSWERRAVVVTVGNHRIAASMTGMPHAGRDDMPARKVVTDRSGRFGTGVNYDSIKGNGMDGHFDIHFLGSKTHGTNRVDERHQAMVQKAAAYLMN